MNNQENVATPQVVTDHPYRKKMIVRAARLVHSADVCRYEDLPENIKVWYTFMPYKTIVFPLIVIDRKKGLTNGQLSNKYGVTVRTIEYLFCCRTAYLDPTASGQDEEA